MTKIPQDVRHERDLLMHYIRFRLEDGANPSTMASALLANGTALAAYWEGPAAASAVLRQSSENILEVASTGVFLRPVGRA